MALKASEARLKSLESVENITKLRLEKEAAEAAEKDRKEQQARSDFAVTFQDICDSNIAYAIKKGQLSTEVWITDHHDTPAAAWNDAKTRKYRDIIDQTIFKLI